MTHPTGLGLEFDVENPTGEQGLAITLPGFLESTEQKASRELASGLVDKGFAAVRLDFRGSWRNHSSLDDYRTSLHVEDLRHLVARAGHRRVVVAGYCYGASVAVVAASLDERITDVVALMPTRHFVWADDSEVEPGDARDPVDHTFRRTDPLTNAQVSFPVPYRAVEDSQQHDLVDALGRVSARILFVAGRRDGVAVPGRVRDLHDVCSSQDKTVVVLDVDHDYRDAESDRSTVTTAVVEWVVAQQDQPAGT